MTTADTVGQVKRVTSWLRAALVGAIVGGLIGPAVGLIIFLPFALVNHLSGHDALTALAALPVWLVFAIIAVGPIGWGFRRR